MKKLNTTIKAPWLSSYKDIPFHLEYPDVSMFDMVEECAKKHPEVKAYDFLGVECTYRKFVEKVHTCAKALVRMGIKPGDKVTICMPNSPQALFMFYGLNLIGAIGNMVHPLSSEGEIEFFLKDSKSRAAITLDQFYPKFEAIRNNYKLEYLIITSIKDELNIPMAAGYWLTQGRKIKKVPKDADIVDYNDFMRLGAKYKGEYAVKRKGNDPAVILYSGGTTGTTKGILLSNLNFNALSMQTITAGDCIHLGHAMLSIMPVFHGFGLGVCIHAMLSNSCKCILVPRFNAASYAKLLKKKRPNYIAGVPTLFEALLRNPYMDKVDLSCLEGVFSGGDSLSIELKKKLDKFLKDHGAKVQVREGYGTTECVTASCLTPKDFYKEGSIGIPYPDTYYKIVKVGTTQEVPYDEEGEICLHGPSVMIEYCNNAKETADTLRTHDDGYVWLHTGDLGKMDDEGFIYFSQRIKRMIITSGYNVYPSQIENIIDAHEAVSMSCVIGVKDPYKTQKVKAFVVLKPGFAENEETRQCILEYCRKNIAKYAMPYEIEFRKDLPKTLVGKVAYRVLEKEELEKDSVIKTA